MHQERLLPSGSLSGQSRQQSVIKAQSNNWNPCASPHDDSDSDDDLIPDQSTDPLPHRPFDMSLSFHECQSPSNEDESPEDMIDLQILERQNMLARLSNVIGELEKDVEHQNSSMCERRFPTESSVQLTQLPIILFDQSTPVSLGG